MPVQSKPSKGPCLECFEKVWPAIFLEDRNPDEEESFVKNRLDVDAFGESHLLCFLQDYEDDVPACEVDEVVSYCGNVHPSILTQHDPGQPKKLWLDDRTWTHHRNPVTLGSSQNVQGLRASESPYWASWWTSAQNWRECHQTTSFWRRTDVAAPENISQTALTARGPSKNIPGHKATPSMVEEHLNFRKYEAPLSVAQLFHHLKQKQFGHASLPDADRRLIYGSDLSPPAILAIAKTAPPHQVPSLREALFKYLALQTSMRVMIPARDYTVFHMDFHVTFFALRNCPPKECSQDGVNLKPRRKTRDISFLHSDMSIHEAQISFTICGPAESRWVAYAFVDTYYDDDQEMSEDEFDDTGMVVDQLAPDGKVNAKHPIWDPREYYLLIVLSRLKQVVKEWRVVVLTVEKGIVAYMDGPPSVGKGTGSRREEDQATKTTFDWTQKTLDLLWLLLDVLSKTNEAWSRFVSHDGDIGYFRDMDNASRPSRSREHMQRSLSEIKMKFEDLEDFQQTLKRLERRCRNSAEILQIRLNLESNQAANLNCFTSEIMISIISPPVVVSAVFAIPEPFGAFRRNGASFALAIFLVFAVLKLLIIFRGRAPLVLHWIKVVTTKEKLLPGGFNFGARLSRLGRSSRSGTGISSGTATNLSAGMV